MIHEPAHGQQKTMDQFAYMWLKFKRILTTHFIKD